MGDYYTQEIERIDASIAELQAAMAEISQAETAIRSELADLEAQASKTADQLQPGEIIASVHARRRLEIEGPELRRALRDLEKRRTALSAGSLSPALRRRQSVLAAAALPGQVVERLERVLADVEALVAGTGDGQHSEQLLKIVRSLDSGLRESERLLAR